MKLPVLILLLFVSTLGLADEGLTIPRSTVVELTEASTQRVYPVFIKLPRSYRSNPDKHYPVIYLTDAWYSFQIASGATRFPMNSGDMPEAILVAISYSKGSRGASSRVRDYTPEKAQDWEMATGNASGHATFIREVVFPYIEGNYRAKATERTYAGNSLGGLFGAYLLFSHPDMFSNYILGSPSVWFHKDAILSYNMAKSSSPLKVFVAVGAQERPEFGEQQDMVAGAKKLVAKIQSESKGPLTLKFSVIEGARHSTAFPTTLIQGLDWAYRQ